MSLPNGFDPAGADECIAIGRVTRTQGNRGAVRIVPFFEPIARFDELKTEVLLLGPDPGRNIQPVSPANLKPYRVSSHSYHQQCLIVHFEEIPDMTAAEKLRGSLAYVLRSQLWDLEEGQFLAYELEGMTVFDLLTGEPAGVVVRVDAGAAHDFLAVRHNGKDYLLPMVREFVVEIDLAARTIRVKIPPGLLDL